MTTMYDSVFFDAITAHSISSARACIPDVKAIAQPASVIDVGCGRGAFLKVFQEMGIDDLMGIDGDYVEPSTLLIPETQFKSADLALPFTLDRSFDLAVCLEVAEHLPEQVAGSFITSLCSLSPIIWFSAAMVGQGGTGHLNEKTPKYWIQQFAANGYACIDCLRSKWLSNDNIAWWYAQNSLLFVRADLSGLARNRAKIVVGDGDLNGCSIIHPELYNARMQEISGILNV